MQSVPLQIVNADVRHFLANAIVFHKFGHCSHIQNFCDALDGLHKRQIERILTHTPHVTAVNLDLINRQLAQVVERIESAAHIIERHPATQIFQAPEKHPRLIQIEDGCGLGQLKRQLLARHPGLPELLTDINQQLAITQA